MNPERRAEILRLIERLKDDVALAKKYSLGHTTRLLDMALLELRMKAHAISPAELKAFSRSLEHTVRQRTNGIRKH